MNPVMHSPPKQPGSRSPRTVSPRKKVAFQVRIVNSSSAPNVPTIAVEKAQNTRQTEIRVDERGRELLLNYTKKRPGRWPEPTFPSKQPLVGPGYNQVDGYRPPSDRSGTSSSSCSSGSSGRKDPLKWSSEDDTARILLRDPSAEDTNYRIAFDLTIDAWEDRNAATDTEDLDPYEDALIAD